MGGGLIERLARQDGPVHRADARLKLLILLAYVVSLVLSPPQAWLRLALFGCLPLALTRLAALPLRPLLLRACAVLPFVAGAALLLPLRTPGPAWLVLPLPGGGQVPLSQTGLALAAALGAKAYLAGLASALLAASTPFPQLLRGLRGLGLPALPTLIVAFVVRYLAVVGDEARRLQRAAAARGFGPRSPQRLRTAGALLCALLLRSFARAERVFLAMSARGFAGELPGEALRRPRALELGATALLLLGCLALGLAPLG